MFPLSSVHIALLGVAAGAVVGVLVGRRSRGTELAKALWSFQVLSAALAGVGLALYLSLMLARTRLSFEGERAETLVADPKQLLAALQKQEATLAGTNGALLCFAGAFTLWFIVGLFPLLRKLGAQAVDVEQERATKTQIENWQLSGDEKASAAEKV